MKYIGNKTRLLGFIDEVIKPSTTREKLIKAFKISENKKRDTVNKKHGNIPL